MSQVTTPTLTTTAPIRKEWLTPADLEAEYDIPKSSQNKMRIKKYIPYSKIGGRVRYSRTAINKWLEDAAIVKV